MCICHSCAPTRGYKKDGECPGCRAGQIGRRGRRRGGGAIRGTQPERIEWESADVGEGRRHFRLVAGGPTEGLASGQPRGRGWRCVPAVGGTPPLVWPRPHSYALGLLRVVQGGCCDRQWQHRRQHCRACTAGGGRARRAISQGVVSETERSGGRQFYSLSSAADCTCIYV